MASGSSQGLGLKLLVHSMALQKEECFGSNAERGDSKVTAQLLAAAKGRKLLLGRKLVKSLMKERGDRELPGAELRKETRCVHKACGHASEIN